MSAQRKLRHGLQRDRVKTALLLQRMVEVAGSFDAVKGNFEQVFNDTFKQKVREVYEGKS